MKVVELIDVVYKRKKDGELSYHAKNFIYKHKLDVENTLTNDEAMKLIVKINNADKRELALQYLIDNKCNDKSIDIRNSTYKQVCKFYHTDNQDTGNEIMFQFIQEIKEYLWEWNGSPVSEISNKLCWDNDKESARVKKILTDSQYYQYINNAMFCSDEELEEFVNDCINKNGGGS